MDELVKKYADGHGCFVSLNIQDAQNVQVEMNAGGDNNTSMTAIIAAMIDVAREEGIKPLELIPFISERLLAESA